MHRRLLGLGMAGWLLACGPPPHHYRVERTALVPVPVPDPVSGPPEDTTEVTVAHATVLWAESPQKPPASNVGLYVPRHQPGIMVRWRPLPKNPGGVELDLRVGYEVGLRARAFRVADNGLAASRNSTAFVYWGGYGFSQRFANGIRWSLSSDVMISDVQSRIRLACLDCAGPGEEETEGEVREGFTGLRSQLLVGARRGRIEIAAIGALRNQQYNVGTKNEGLVDGEETGSRMTSIYFPVAGAVAGFRPHPRACVAASVFWPIDPSGRVVRYGPIAGVAITIRSSSKE